jgi:WD40 repeat protein
MATDSRGHRLVTASSTGTLSFWDLRHGLLARKRLVHRDEITALAVTANGKYAISGSDLHSSDGRRVVSYANDSVLKLWTIGRPPQMTNLNGHRGSISAVAFSEDSRFAVSASTDLSLKVWKLIDGQCLATLTTDRECVSCTFSSDGRTIIAGDLGGRLHFLRLEIPETGKLTSA